jgi:hypothetical protein
MSVFTRSGMGGSPGSSNDVKSSKMPGGTMKTATGQDNVHGVDLPDELGCSMGGGVGNLSHSLSGASAVQKQKGS